MIKIKAKQIIEGRVLKLFFEFLYAFILSLSGVLTIVFTLLYSENEKVKSFFTVFGRGEAYFRTAAAVILCFAGILLFACGRKRHSLFACRSVSDNSFSGSAGKTFSFLLYLAVRALFTLCWSFIFFLPFVICLSFLVMSLSQGAMEKNVFVAWASGSAVLFLVGLMFLFVTVQRYSAWKYFLCFEKYGVMDSLYKSLEKTEGRCLSISAFKLSMLGWIFSCFLILPVVYVLPYYNVSTAYYILKGKLNQTIKAENENPFPAVFEIIREN